MKKVNLPWLLPIFLLIGGILIFLNTAIRADSAAATHIVISEVQTAGATVGDEFVELYNPTSFSVDISGWRLRRETSTGGDGGNLVASLSGNIPAHGFFLITPQTEYTGSASADQTYSVGGNPVAANNTVLLYSDAGVTLVDKIGLGTAVNSETSAASNPLVGESVERKANSTSTAVSMDIGGVDEFSGNAEDTDNNSADFIVRTISQPQNSLSEAEPVVVPTPSEVPTPTIEPTAIPTPTIEPTAIPTPTAEPTAIPTVTATPTVVPTVAPSVTPTSPLFPRLFHVTCSIQIKILNFGFFQVQVSIPTCRLVRA